MKSKMLLLKIGAKEHIEDLLYKGIVYCKTIKDYSNQYTKLGDEKNKAWVLDKFEGKSIVLRPDSISIGDNLNELTKIKSNKEHPIIATIESSENPHIFCTYGISNESFVNYNDKYYYHEVLYKTIEKYGGNVCLIYDPEEFVRRIKKNVGSLSVDSGFVKYIIDDENNYIIDPLTKSKIHIDDSEYRLVIKNESHEKEPRKIEIGSITDIATIVDNSMLKFNFRNKEALISIPNNDGFKLNDILR